MLAKVSLIVISLFITHSCAQNSPSNNNFTTCDVDKRCVPNHLCQNGPISATRENLYYYCYVGGACNGTETCCHIHNIISTDDTDDSDYDDDTDSDNIPSVVAILRYNNSNHQFNKTFICGGSLVSYKIVLTSSSCVINQSNATLIVRAGDWDTQDGNEEYNYDERNVRRIITHENYNETTLFNDVALLILESPFEWKTNINTDISLASRKLGDTYSNCFAVGWGNERDCRHWPLKKINLSLFSQSDCRTFINEPYLNSNGSLHESLMCARGPSGNVNCENDNGFPVLCPMITNRKKYIQFGIVSLDGGCNQNIIPGLYSDIPHMFSWISRKIVGVGHIRSVR